MIGIVGVADKIKDDSLKAITELNELVGDINIYVDDVKINYEYTTNYEVIENPYDNFGFVNLHCYKVLFLVLE